MTDEEGDLEPYSVEIEEWTSDVETQAEVRRYLIGVQEQLSDETCETIEPWARRFDSEDRRWWTRRSRFWRKRWR